MKYISTILAAFALMFLMSGSAFAAGFAHGSFETGTAPGVFSVVNSGDSSTITGWTVDSGSVDYIGSYWTAEDGVRSLDMSGNDAGSISQTFDTVNGDDYSVSFYMAGNPAGGPAVKTMNVSATGGATEGYTFDTAGKSTSAMGWAKETYTFTATSSSTTLAFASTTAGFFGPALDNVVVEQVTTPPPVVGPPTDKDQCKNDGWKDFNNPTFKNQGQCVSSTVSNREDNHGQAVRVQEDREEKQDTASSTEGMPAKSKGHTKN